MLLLVYKNVENIFYQKIEGQTKLIKAWRAENNTIRKLKHNEYHQEKNS